MLKNHNKYLQCLILLVLFVSCGETVPKKHKLDYSVIEECFDIYCKSKLNNAETCYTNNGRGSISIDCKFYDEVRKTYVK